MTIDIIALAQTRIADLTASAARLEDKSQALADAALRSRLEIVGWQQFIAMARDLEAGTDALHDAGIAGEVTASTSFHSPETATENAPDPAQAGAAAAAAPAPNPDQGQRNPPPPAGPDASDDVLRPDAAGEIVLPPSISPAPNKRGPYKSKHETINSRVRAAYEANPGLTSRQLAAVMGEEVRRVQDALARLHLQVRRPTGAEMSAVLSASKGVTTRQRILELIADEPDLLRQDVADRIGVKHQYVLRVCRNAGVACPPLVARPEIARKPGRIAYAGREEGDDAPTEAIEAILGPRGWVDSPKPALARPEARQTILRQSSEPLPPRQPSASILARVRKRHEQRPNWTAGIIAKELGLPHDMAQAALDIIKAETV